MSNLSCPLCGGLFPSNGDCHSACPLATNCALVRCPGCGYEFPDPARTKLAGRLARWLGRRGRSEDAP